MTDDEIIEAMRAGSTAAGNLLASRYLSALRSYYRKRLPRDDAEELTQITLLETIGRIDRFRSESTFRHYVFSVARRVMAERHRQLGRRIETEQAPSSEPPGLQTPPNDRLARVEYLHRLNDAVADLDHHYRSVVELHMCGATNREISRELDIQYNTVRSRLSRGLRAVRNYLRPWVDEVLRTQMPAKRLESTPPPN
ncbi:RNA polymerase sigma-70 factor [Enhygromyxa salina]|uniref:RNA polymerase sigma-70 factor n=1 Tax=Enhygromyxa salina TaxID=215803 RepID=A0A0C2CUS2_9BACT|nr:RNA polymerase sigma factor [Enhygromyxa salina]KIG14871.1 RNA polymerase sigma-70 factor [Enhygromyxa salina]